jgi:hypothetical protein
VNGTSRNIKNFPGILNAFERLWVGGFDGGINFEKIPQRTGSIIIVSSVGTNS